MSTQIAERAEQNNTLGDTKMERKKELLILSILHIQKDMNKRSKFLNSYSVRPPTLLPRTRSVLSEKSIEELKNTRKLFRFVQKELMYLETDITGCACFCDNTELEYWLKEKWMILKKRGSGTVRKIIDCLNLP